MARVIYLFSSTKVVIAAERALLAAGLSPTVEAMPEALAGQCGIVLSLPYDMQTLAEQSLQAAGIELKTKHYVM